MKKIVSSFSVVALASLLFVGCNKTSDVVQPQSNTTKPALAARYFLDEQPVVKEAIEKAPHVHMHIDAEGRENYYGFNSEQELIKWSMESDDVSIRLLGEKRQLAQDIYKWKEESRFEEKLAARIEEQSLSKIMPIEGDPIDDGSDKYAISEEELVEMIPTEFTERIKELDTKLIETQSALKGGRTTGVGAGNWYDGYNYTGANLISGWFLTKPVGAGIKVWRWWIVRPAAWNDRISSLNYYTVFAWYVCYEHNWYQGQSRSFTSASEVGQDYPNFGVYNMDNKISSIL